MIEEPDGERWGPSIQAFDGSPQSLLFLSSTDLAYPPAHNENSSAPISQGEPHGHHQNLLPPAAR